ncbi:MAG TPA: lactate racemase domain-containing protein [Pyrinomonadaceae bacterium]|nr:lactate racemase domain-containing protein [Pyrinomonadaceae bacterium]
MKDGERSIVFGEGSVDSSLGRSVLRQIVSRSLEAIPDGARILAIVPDKTRDDITNILLPLAIDELKPKSPSRFEVLIAQGTHAAMTDAEKGEKTGRENWADWALDSVIHDHRWNDPSEIIEIGEIGAETVSDITEGAYTKSVKVSVNRLLSPANCDFIIIFGAVVPHEVAGFAGGAKYLFPGVSGRELTNVTHWIGALSGIENVIGRVETPVRRMIETAADMIPARIVCFSSVVSRDDHGDIAAHGLFSGDLRESFRSAAELSRKVHIKQVGRKYRRVVALLDSHYDELWTGGKASYKLGGIIEGGGELIIHAPQITEFSRMHGKGIERFGYAPIERVREMVAASPDLARDLCVAAHLAHVAYGSQSNGEQRFRITLSSAISRDRCEAANLSYADPSEFDIERYRSDTDTLIVERAGRDLYVV